MPSISDIGFFNPSLQHDFPELCLFQNVKIFCNRIRRLKFAETDILDLLPSCLRGEALTWFRRQSKYHNLALCIGAIRSRFWQASQQAPQTSQPAPQVISQSACQEPDYHHCKLCNASFSSMARLIRHTQENTCNKPCCRHCETAFSSKNQLHRHLREDCRKQMHRQRGSSSRSSSRSSSSPSPQSSPRSSSLPTSTCLPACSPTSSPLPSYRAISPSPPSYLTVADLSTRFAKTPYLKVDDLFRMFGPRSASTKSSNHQIQIRPSTRIIITSDDPFARPFVLLKKSMGSTIWELGLGTSYDQIAQAQCSSPRSACERCRSPILDIDKRQARPNLV